MHTVCGHRDAFYFVRKCCEKKQNVLVLAWVRLFADDDERKDRKGTKHCPFSGFDFDTTAF